MDLIQETLAGGATLRIPSVLGLCTRECLLLAGDHSFRGEQVAGVPGDPGEKRSLPAPITVDYAHVEAFHDTLYVVEATSARGDSGSEICTRSDQIRGNIPQVAAMAQDPAES